ncbi:hypothetical protein [Arenimonas oryziterrae]|uniref:Phasin domain-containing protein n=1 Tax=Arenimonas oryziterrae DSM 21050 = YC6267 TaxID=1121015 RepID=A0A091AW73_9GAMM|nr:hypothetical protein [Arenimonas oryziterrae]KFN42914.1 hypothetical protein N789_12375 [Arenimonas oryziterrae DSM 21050 = YC6267]
MARKISKRTPRATKNAPVQPRELLLAGIGAVSLGRKQAIKSYADTLEGAADLRARAEAAVQDAVETVSGKVVALRKQAKASVGPMQKKVIALASEAKTQAETRLAPVLAKFGVKKKAIKRTAAKKKPVAKRPVKRGRRAA